jgi:sugar-specific transcriptional regulator TrmB
MDKLDKCYNIVLQNTAKGGLTAIEVGEKLGIYRTTAYDYLNSLELMGKVENVHGRWRAKTGEQTIKPLEKEIVIELPIPKNQWREIAKMEATAKYLEHLRLLRTAEDIRIILETFNETRIIRIKGKNVDDLSLEKLGNFVQQANEKSSKINLRGLLKRLKGSHANYPQEDVRAKRD